MTTKEAHEGRGGQEFKGNLERNNVREPVQWEVVWLEVPGSSEFSRSFGVPGLLRWRVQARHIVRIPKRRFRRRVSKARTRNNFLIAGKTGPGGCRFHSPFEASV